MSESHVPEGWQLVPLEPTEEMLRASHQALKVAIDGMPANAKVLGRFGGTRLTRASKARIRFQAMVAAAPKPPEPSP